MILRNLTIILVSVCLTGIATAGLDNDGRFDRVVAIYHFEDGTDSGPRNFDGGISEGLSIVRNGKIGKCLRFQRDALFGTLEDQHLGIIGREFSIVAWVKLRKQKVAFGFNMAGRDDDRTFVGSIQLSIEPSGNIKGEHFDFEDDKLESIVSSKKRVSNNRWHHIAFSKYADTYSLFIDGEIVKRKRSDDYLGFVGDGTFIFISAPRDEHLRGSVFIDEVGFFETGFSIYEIKGLYNDGLTDFLEAMPVDPQDKVATTWGEVKHSSGRY